MGCRFARFGEEKMSQGQSDAELRLVTPGMAIGPCAGKRIGSGAIALNDEIIATKLGWAREFNGTVSVDPINSSYIPRSGDLIVATVAEVRNNLWFMNINGSFQGLLPMSLAPWKVEYGQARQHMDVGDSSLARVQEVDECHNVVLTMKGVGLRRLNQGTVVNVPINHIDRPSFISELLTWVEWVRCNFPPLLWCRVVDSMSSSEDNGSRTAFCHH